MMDDLEIPRMPELGSKCATAAFDILSEVEVDVPVPDVVESAAAQHDAVLAASWEDVCRVVVDSAWGTEVHSVEGLFGVLD